MRKAARSQIALGLGLVLLTACQSADRSIVAPTAATSDQEPGRVRAAADPVPVPGAPGSVPVPGGPNSTPVPGKPQKSPAPGTQPTPTPAPTATPTPVPTPTPAATLTFSSSDVPKVATFNGTQMAITSIIPVSGITGAVTNITVALRATVPDDSQIRDIRVLKNYRFSQTAATPLYSDTFAGSLLSGADLGTSCTPFGGATTFDDRVTTAPLSSGSAPYAGVFRSEFTASPLSAMATALRDPLDSNGNWQLDMFLQPGAAATLECWTLRIEFLP
jgi:hypothetical protein